MSSETRNETFWYLCDPNKNTSCRKTSCKPLGRDFCEYTSNPEYKRDGTNPFIIVRNPEKCGFELVEQIGE
jgi:hypothetical protein